MKNFKVTGVTLGISAALLLTACGNGDGQAPTDGGEAENVSEALDYTITGIEPGTGTTAVAQNAIDSYGSLEGWELETSSTAGMLTQLGEAIENEEPIIVNGWSPHYKFVQYDLKFLEDPQDALGVEEDIHTITRLGLDEEMPNAYQILDAFEWEAEDMETVMYEAQESSIEEAAMSWVEDNQDQVDSWLEGAEQVDGEEIELISTIWDTERSSTNVLRIALEQQGYDVTITEVDPAIMFEAIANGEADASVSPWLPITHASFYEANEDNFIDLGPNLTGARVGFVVPEYMDIDSIEDLEPNN